MNATIKDILRDLPGSGGRRYHRIRFETDDGRCVFTDLVPTFRNFARWKPHLEIGAHLGNLRLLKANKIDADSHPVRIKPEPDPQLEMFASND